MFERAARMNVLTRLGHKLAQLGQSIGRRLCFESRSVEGRSSQRGERVGVELHKHRTVGVVTRADNRKVACIRRFACFDPQSRHTKSLGLTELRQPKVDCVRLGGHFDRDGNHRRCQRVEPVRSRREMKLGARAIEFRAVYEKHRIHRGLRAEAHAPLYCSALLDDRPAISNARIRTPSGFVQFDLGEPGRTTKAIRIATDRGENSELRERVCDLRLSDPSRTFLRPCDPIARLLESSGEKTLARLFECIHESLALLLDRSQGSIEWKRVDRHRNDLDP